MYKQNYETLLDLICDQILPTSALTHRNFLSREVATILNNKWKQEVFEHIIESEDWHYFYEYNFSKDNFSQTNLFTTNLFLIMQNNLTDIITVRKIL